jgi:phosphoribosylglycinamide formyltransferase-1
MALKIVVLISGSGSNLQAIIDATVRNKNLFTISAVVSNRSQAYGLERAKQANIATEVLSHKDYADRVSYDKALVKIIDNYQPDLIVLAGFMRILSPYFVNYYNGRIMNIHPSLLPKFKGLHTHQRVIDAKEKEHGATVHFVNAELDAGAIIIQAKVPVLPNDNVEVLAARVLEQEHRIYPEAIILFATGKI